MSAQSLFLVGPMGSGKSTIGRQLAKTLHREFKDCDHELVRRTGASIPLIFEIEGEEGFRRREQQLLDELTQEPELVMATGGGAVLNAENRHNLINRGIVLYLYASVDQLFERTRKDRNRPLLQTSDPRSKLEELMNVRDPLYREVADIVIHTEDRSVRSVVKEIAVRLQKEFNF